MIKCAGDKGDQGPVQERQGACQVRHQAAVSADNTSLLQAAASMETVTMSGARGREEAASMEA